MIYQNQTKEQHLESLRSRIAYIRRNGGKGPARITWESRLTGYKGKGKVITGDAAIVAALRAEREFPHIDHWIEYPPID